jgi:4-hydroxy-tetrahydrodipicolinate synthase
MDHVSEIATRCSMTILSGDDSLTLPIAAVGGKGVISVVSNIVPADVKALTDAILESDYTTALKWHKKLYALSKGMLSLATNPIPVKAAMAMLNLAGEEMRLPLVPMEESKKALLRKTLQEYGLLK